MNVAMIIDKEQINSAGIVLNDKKQTLAARFRALFLLRSAKDNLSVEWISKCFIDTSELLKHELAYCLGQMQNPTAIPHLIRVLEDEKQEPMVRHEAGEALAAIGDQNEEFGLKEILERFIDDPVKEVAETCQLALQMIEWKKENRQDCTPNKIYDSIDPTPAASDGVNMEELGEILIDQSQTLWDRYKALFALRNLNDDRATKLIAQGLFCEDSALFRHEIAYVLGQIQSPIAIPELSKRLYLASENAMVRHECAEALGSIANEECQQILKGFLHDTERVVRESCEVALDIAEINNKPGL